PAGHRQAADGAPLPGGGEGTEAEGVHADPVVSHAAQEAPRAAPARKEQATAMSAPETVQVEASGETVGEARWAALHELERRYPALDRSRVEFVVLSERERALLRVGYEPARVLATLTDVPAEGAATAAPSGHEGRG